MNQSKQQTLIYSLTMWPSGVARLSIYTA